MNLEGNNISSQSDDDQLPDDELVEELYDKEKSGAENATIDIYSKDRKVIKMKGRIPNLLLPKGWIGVNHRSGGIIYLHKKSRVVTWSRPYHIGPASIRVIDPIDHLTRCYTFEEISRLGTVQGVGTDDDSSTLFSLIQQFWSNPHEKEGPEIVEKKHDAPVISIPCLHQHRAIKEEEEKKKQEEKRKKVEAWKEKRKMPFENTVEESPSKCSRTLTNNDAVVGNGSVESGMTGGNDLSSPSVHPHVTVKQERRPEAESQDRVAATQSMSNHSGAEIKKELNGDESESSKGKSSEVSNSGENTEAECSRPNDRARPQTLKPNAGSSENVSEKLELIDVDEIHAYLARIYEFDNISALEEKRPIFSDDGPIEEPEKPTELPSQLKSLPYLVKGKGRKTTKEMVISPGGKTPVMLLNEYCQRLMSTKPEYKESHRQNPQSPFGIEVIINGMKYGDGEGNTKKLAKQMAAEKTLSILVPDKFKQVQDYTFSGKELEVFDELDIEDENIADYAKKIGLMSPSQVLITCLKRRSKRAAAEVVLVPDSVHKGEIIKRAIKIPDPSWNHGLLDSKINFKFISNGSPSASHQYEITCGKHEAKGPCKNKKIGKQLAAQTILKLLHPKLEKWGSLVKMYCDNKPAKLLKKKGDETEDVLKSISDRKRPQPELLRILKEEMHKLESKEDTTPTSKDILDGLDV